MNEAERISRLRAVLRGEIDEALPVLGRRLISLGDVKSDAVRNGLIDELLRQIHGLKGAAASAHAAPISRACHLMEDLLAGLRPKGEGLADQDDRLALLLATVDALGQPRLLAGSGDDPCDGRLDDLLERLAAAAQTGVAPPPPSRGATRPADGGGESVFEGVCSELARMATEHAEAEGKRLDFQLEGAPWRVDDGLALRLRDPLRHLVRNAVRHGIGTPQARAAEGKPERGRITIEAVPDGEWIRVRVADDGSGIDIDALVRAARQRGLPVPQRRAERAQMVFEPGLTTLREVDETAGRGLGLDAVRATLAGLGGTVSVDTEAGAGTRFTLSIPVERRVSTLLLVANGNATFAIEEAAVDTSLTLRASDVHWVLGRPWILVDSRVVPLARLSDLLGEDHPARSPGWRGAPRSESFAGQALVLCDGDRVIALRVDAVTDALRLAASWRHLARPGGLVAYARYLGRLLRNAPCELSADEPIRPLNTRFQSSVLKAALRLEGDNVVWLLDATAVVSEAMAVHPTAFARRGELR